jgi:hypothetical protein
VIATFNRGAERKNKMEIGKKHLVLVEGVRERMKEKGRSLISFVDVCYYL